MDCYYHLRPLCQHTKTFSCIHFLYHLLTHTFLPANWHAVRKNNSRMRTKRNKNTKTILISKMEDLKNIKYIKIPNRQKPVNIDFVCWPNLSNVCEMWAADVFGGNETLIDNTYIVMCYCCARCGILSQTIGCLRSQISITLVLNIVINYKVKLQLIFTRSIPASMWGHIPASLWGIHQLQYGTYTCFIIKYIIDSLWGISGIVTFEKQRRMLSG